jgi:hypothetical protein
LATVALPVDVGLELARCSGPRKSGEVCILEYGTDADAFRRALNDTPDGGTLTVPAGSYELRDQR